MSYNIFDNYTQNEIKDIIRTETKDWPEKFKDIMLVHLANELVAEWLDNNSEDQYRLKIVTMVNNYGWLDS